MWTSFTPHECVAYISKWNNIDNTMLQNLEIAHKEFMACCQYEHSILLELRSKL